MSDSPDEVFFNETGMYCPWGVLHASEPLRLSSGDHAPEGLLCQDKLGWFSRMQKLACRAPFPWIKRVVRTSLLRPLG